MRKTWRNILTVGCAVLLFLSTPMTVLADDLFERVTTAAEVGEVKNEPSEFTSASTDIEITGNVDNLSVTPLVGVAEKSFTDVKNVSHPYYKAIYWAADAGITKGYSDGTFGINRSCTRGEMMMFLWRYAGKPAPKNVSKSPFKDVSKTHTFYKAILWGSQKGITKGYSDGTFGINRNVSRGECMMFLWRLKGKPAPKAVAKTPFPDVPKSHVFYNAVLWGYQKKITTGFTSGKLKGKFGVNENCSRGQIVTFIYRIEFGPASSTDYTGSLCKVTFDSNGGSLVDSIECKKGHTISAPAIPVKEGYVFVGWYTGDDFNEAFLFDEDIITENTTLFAKWIVDDKEVLLSDYVASRIIIGFQNGDSATNVTKDVYLMTSLEEVPDAVIEWDSDNPSIIGTDGSVNRVQDDVLVKLTATVKVGNAQSTVSFDLLVIREIDESAISDNYSVNDIQNMNDGNAEIEFNDDETQVSFIDGKFSQVIVNNSADALDAIQSIHTIIGINNAYEELSEAIVTKDEYGGEYTFQQNYQGYRIYGRDITVSADSNGVTDFLTSNLCVTSIFESTDLNINLSIEEATSNIFSQYGPEITVNDALSETVIYSFDEYESSPVLAHIIYISGKDSSGNNISKKEIIDSKTGSTILSISTRFDDETINGSGKDEKGTKVSFPIRFTLTDWFFFYMYDSSTNVQMYKDGLLSDHRIGSEFNHWTDGQAISAYVNMRKVIAWWRSTFNRNSLDGNGMEVRTIVHDNDNDLRNNAYWSSSDNSIHITDASGNVVKFSRAVALDVLTHESTHAVIQYDVGNDFGEFYQNAPGAINEGYADTFGCLNNHNWTHGEDLYTSASIQNGTTITCTRNIAKPSDSHALSKGPDKLSSPLYIDYTSNSADNGGVHTNGFLISHAAYLMNKNGMSYETLGKLFYKSLRMGYTIRSDFYDVRKNILKAAKKIKLSNSEVQIIKNAFDEEEIYGDTGTLKGTVKDKAGNIVTNAAVSIFYNSSVLKNIYTNGNGGFSENLEVDTYTIEVSANGFLPYKTVCQIKKNKTVNLEIVLVKEGNGVIQGTITNATTANKLAGVTINVRNGQNQYYGSIIAETVTDSNGYYEINISSGYYTLEFIREGYTTDYANIIIDGGAVVTKNEALSPIMQVGTYRVVLTWGSSPSDLDSHLTGLSADGTSFHVYYSSKYASDASGNEIGNLDVDDTTSYGPETVTFNAETTGSYYYYVYRYSSSGSLSGSSANIRVYYGDNLVGDYNINSSADASLRYWNVFKIENGIFKIVNTVTESAVISTYRANNTLMNNRNSKSQDSEPQKNEEKAINEYEISNSSDMEDYIMDADNPFGDTDSDDEALNTDNNPIEFEDCIEAEIP